MNASICFFSIMSSKVKSGALGILPFQLNRSWCLTQASSKALRVYVEADGALVCKV